MEENEITKTWKVTASIEELSNPSAMLIGKAKVRFFFLKKKKQKKKKEFVLFNFYFLWKKKEETRFSVPVRKTPFCIDPSIARQVEKSWKNRSKLRESGKPARFFLGHSVSFYCHHFGSPSFLFILFYLFFNFFKFFSFLVAMLPFFLLELFFLFYSFFFSFSRVNYFFCLFFLVEFSFFFFIF